MKKIIGSIAAIAVASALVVGVGIWGFGWFQTSTALAEQLQEQLTVPESAPVSSEAACTANTYSSNSLATVGEDVDQRRWSDAISLPFAEEDSNTRLRELIDEICRNPTLGDATAAALMAMDFGGNFDIAAANPWLAEFREGWNAAPGGGLNWLLVNEAGEYFVSPDYQDKAELVNQLLLQFSLMGVTERASSANWHIAGVVATELPRASENSVQEDLPALLLRFTFKGEAPDNNGDGWPDNGCLPGEYAIGFNLLDKRPELFDGCPVEKQDPPEAPKDDDSSTNPPTPSTPPDNPPSVTPPPETTVPPTVTPKNPTKDPAQQGKASTGGGKNANPGPGKLTKDPGEASATPRVNPAPPKPTLTPRTIPVQPAEPKVNPAPAPSSPTESELEDPPANSGPIEQPEW